MLRLAGRFGEGLLFCERLRNRIRETRSVLKINRPFDFELAFDRIPSITTAKELMFCLQWLKPGVTPPNWSLHIFEIGEAQVWRKSAAICRHFQCAIDCPPKCVEVAARAAAGRVTCSLRPPDVGPEAIETAAELLLG